MASAEYHIYERALRSLAGDDPDMATQRNDVGFNAFDAPVGHNLAEQGYASWSMSQTRLAYTLLRRYSKTQLPGFGFDFASFPDPPTKEQEVEQRSEASGGKSRRGPGWAICRTDGKRVFLSWGGDDPLFMRRVKDTKERFVSFKFDAESKEWVVPLTIQNITSLSSMLAEYAVSELPFTEDEGLRDVIWKQLETIQRKLAESSAKTAEAVTLTFEKVRNAHLMRPFQIAGVQFAVENRMTIIADDMGLGKTLQAIAANLEADTLPVVVVCPASLKLNWKREIDMWSARVPSIFVADGKNGGAIPAGTQWVIINYEVLEGWIESILKIKPKGIVLDEAHYIKSASAKRSKAAALLIRKAKPEMRLLLTGTPILNRPAEMWSPLSLIDGQAEFGSWWKFVERYANAKETRFGLDTSGAANLNELNLRLRSSGKMLRRKKEDVLTELPDKQWARLDLPMQGDGLKKYLMAERDLNRYRATQGLPPVPQEASALVLISTLRQLSWEAKSKAAFDWIDNFLESGKKLVVFGWHQVTIRAIAERYGAPTITGSDSKLAVQAGKDAFQNDPDVRVIVCNIAAGGVGHTLTAASDVAFVEFAWNEALMDQAISRAHRLGQHNAVTGWLLSGLLPEAAVAQDYLSIDDYMADLIVNKGTVSREGTDGLGQQSQRAMIERMRELLAQQDATDVAEELSYA